MASGITLSPSRSLVLPKVYLVSPRSARFYPPNVSPLFLGEVRPEATQNRFEVADIRKRVIHSEAQ